jgi:hypothetical protein
MEGNRVVGGRDGLSDDATLPAWYDDPPSRRFPRIAEIRRTYADLVWAYTVTLSKASRIGRSADGDSLIAAYKTKVTSVWLIRLMVTSHISRHLGDLRKAYVALLPISESDDRQWFDQALEDIERLTGTLPEVRPRAVGLALIAPLAALASKLAGLPDWFVFVLAALAGAAPTVVIFGYFVVRNSYGAKRQLLFPAAPEVDRLSPSLQEASTHGFNVYSLEAEAFKVIGRGRRAEYEVDRFLVFSAGWLTGLACFIVGFAIEGNGSLNLPLTIGGLGVLLVDGLYALHISSRRKRVWR